MNTHTVFNSLKLNRPVEIRVVLVRPIYERNVGATSRAMDNMGFKNLILIQPQCEFTIEAQKAAARGQSPFQNKVVYSDWDEFFKNEPDSLRISMTARDGRGRAVRRMEEILSLLPTEAPQLQLQTQTPLVVHVFFGPEDWGLSQEDIQYSHYCCSIPTFGENPSLNLAQAVLLALFLIRQFWGGDRTVLDGQQPDRNQKTKPISFPDSILKTWLTEMGFDLSKRRINSFTVLRRMLLQNTPTEKELRILEIVLQQSIRKFKELKNLRLGQTDSPAQSKNE